jgi:hypothetical protein
MAHAWKAMVAACTTTPSVRTIVSLRFETFGIANGAAGSRTESEAPWVSFATPRLILESLVRSASALGAARP